MRFMKHSSHFVFAILVAATAFGQASRTWVSGVGDDANPCSRTAPCKTLAGAISKTAAGGEIDALDPAGYGAVTITKAITIDGGGGQVASVLVSGTNGIVVQAGANDNIIIRNFDINGIGTGINGIRFLAGKSLGVENCSIFGFTTNGIDVALTNFGTVTVNNTTIQNNGGVGISFNTTNGVTAAINAVRAMRNSTGVYAGTSTHATIRDSTIVENSYAGVNSAGSNVDLSIEDSILSHNGRGLQSGPNPSVTRLSNTLITDSSVFGIYFAGGTVYSFGNNRIQGNAGNNGSGMIAVGQQ